MNTYELDTLTLQYCDEAVTNTNRTLYSPIFLAAYNDAYAGICTERIQPKAYEAVTLDAERCFSVSDLSNRMKKILDVSELEDFSAANGFRPSRPLDFLWKDHATVRIPLAPGSVVWVRYEYLPAALVNATPTTEDGNTSEPALLDEAVHGALCMYAAAAHWRVRKKFEREADWMNAYYMTIRSVEGRRDQRDTSMRNVIPSMPML
jgi:hypothetical protein